MEHGSKKKNNTNTWARMSECFVRGRDPLTSSRTTKSSPINTTINVTTFMEDQYPLWSQYLSINNSTTVINLLHQYRITLMGQSKQEQRKQRSSSWFLLVHERQKILQNYAAQHNVPFGGGRGSTHRDTLWKGYRIPLDIVSIWT